MTKDFETVAAKVEYHKLFSWDERDLWNDGHAIEKIFVTGGNTMATKDTNYLDTTGKDCGYRVPTVKGKKPVEGTISVSTRINTNCQMTRYFYKVGQLDNLMFQLAGDKNFRNVSFVVKELVTRNYKTGQVCKWKHGSAGDGTVRKSMILEEVDGKHYTELTRAEIFDAAAGMAESVCELMPPKTGRGAICMDKYRNGGVDRKGRKVTIAKEA